jgi:hypothetical protein
MDTIQNMGAKYFMKLDVAKAFNNVQIKDADQWKAAFKNTQGHKTQHGPETSSARQAPGQMTPLLVSQPNVRSHSLSGPTLSIWVIVYSSCTTTWAICICCIIS